jgi:hypothetical protein
MPGDIVFTPFLGIGSEVWAAVESGRRGLGFELKPSYFRQAPNSTSRRNSGCSTSPTSADVEENDVGSAKIAFTAERNAVDLRESHDTRTIPTIWSPTIPTPALQRGGKGRCP